MSASIAINNKNNKNNNKIPEKKSIKSPKSVKAVQSKKSVPSCDCRAMNRLSTSSAPPLSPPLRNKSKAHLSSPTSQSRTSTEEDVIDMPVLTPEVPFESNVEPPVLEDIVKPPSPDLNYVDLSAPPVLSPALDEDMKSKSGSNCVKIKKRKPKCVSPKVKDNILNSLFQLSDYNSDSIFMSGPKSPKKMKSSPKKSKLIEVNKTKKYNKNIFGDKSLKIAKELEESSRKLFKVLNTKSKSKPKMNIQINSINESNGWSVDSNHTMSSVNSSVQTSQPFMKCRNLDETNANGMDCAQNESLLSHNSSIFDNPFKFRQKLIKKSKTALNSQLMRAEANKAVNKSHFNELIGVQKPEPEVDEIEGIRFQSFESEESINLFSKFEQLEKEQREQTSISKTFGIKSLKSGKLIFPTKTKDITKIKGWREKLFSSKDEKQNKRPIGLSNNFIKSQTNDKTYRSLISDTSIGGPSSSGSKSAFVSDFLEGYLKSKPDLKMNYLSPDFAAPPDDSPIFSASVLKMPDFGPNPMPPPFTPSTSNTFSKKKNLFKTKGMKNKSTLETLLTNDSIQSSAEEDMREILLPQYPVIQDTLWPEKPLSDDQMSRLYDDYIEFTNNEMQQMKKPSAPSLVMDDNYARFALSALQCNPRIPFINESDQTSEDVLLAVGLAPTKQKTPSPIKDTKIKGRYRKDREADLAKIIAMGNRSKRQIRLPSRFHESSLLMGNQWIIPDYDQKGKTGKRRLQEEQRRLQELHQKQLEIEQRKQPSLTIETNTSLTTDDTQLSLIHKRLSNGTKSKLNPLNIPTVSTDYPLKIPHQRLKQMQLIRDQKKQKSVHKQKNETPKLDKSFTSLYSMSTQGVGDKRVLSLSAKAAASANQRAQVNQLFLHLSETVHPDKNSMICRNGKLNKSETLKDAIETIEKLTKREQQLSYIRKLLQMWNHKLQLCSKVAQKDLKPEAFKVVNDVMNTYRSSMCYKVGEALEAKRKEFQQKRAQQLSAQQTAQQNVNQSNASQKKPQLSNSSQLLTIPSAKTTSFKTPSKALKPSNQRLILPKLPILSKNLKPKQETVVNAPSIYPKLTTPDLHHKNVIDSSLETEFIGREGSLLKPPILTTRPTILKPYILPSNEGLHSSTSVTGPVINYPDISKIKSMSKSLNISSGSSSLIAPLKSNSSASISSSSANVSSRLKLPFNNIKVTVLPNTSMSSSVVSNSQSKTTNLYSPHSYATGKNMIITSETPLANEDLNLIVASIASNPDQFKKVPVRLSNGRAALTIPNSSSIASSSKSSSIGSPPILTIGSAPGVVKSRGNSWESKDDSKSQKSPKSQTLNSSLSQNTVSKFNSLQKPTKVSERVSSQLDYSDFIEID